MKRFLGLSAVLSIFAIVPFATAGISLSVAPQDEWEWTPAGSVFVVDFHIGSDEYGEFYICIPVIDPAGFIDAVTGPAAGDLGQLLADTEPDPGYSAYRLTIGDSQNHLPGGVAARFTLLQEMPGNTLLEVFKDPDYDTTNTSLLIAVFYFFPGDDDDIPIPDNKDDVPEPATIALLGLGALAVLRKR